MVIVDISHSSRVFFFFFNDTATTEIYTLSLHDALPISSNGMPLAAEPNPGRSAETQVLMRVPRDGDYQVEVASSGDRKSTRLNSSHLVISYAVFCLKKKKRYTDLLAASSSHE